MSYSKIKIYSVSFLTILILSCEGEVGPMGASGEDGLNSLVNITNEPSGANCENGGIKVEVGIDNNSNGTLDNNEILSTSYICNGIDGNSSLTRVVTEPSGANCENGGIRIDSGVDVDGDGTLDDSEVTTTAYVCNGVDGNNSLTKITTETAGTNCTNGGLRLDIGVDVDGDGTLDDSEITATAYVCNGVDGNNSLIKTTTEPSGANCENGGIRIDSGVDTNGNDVLDNDEILVTRFVCNGIDGGFDEEIRFLLRSNIGLTSSTPFIYSSDLIDFDINNYNKIDSAVFMVDGAKAFNGASSIFFDLYNSTDNQAITDSELSTRSTTEVRLTSSNILTNLPTSKVDFGVRLRAEVDGQGGDCDRVFLILFRSSD